MTDTLRVLIGGEAFPARLERALAPATCAAFEALLPHEDLLVHARWSGEACWIPMGEADLGVGTENAVERPEPGQVLFYPGGASETEVLIPYGVARFACKVGPLAGNHFLTLGGDLERLAALGRDVLWRGAAPVRFER